ncbi:MAG: aspartyl-tRNA(Asn)/glutamyl-tRNA(Gln) amidotransferase subunit A [Candidatus Woesearchaeota archaeon]|jgi:aspartyl-tRNA(Asn)/glutamyl-tRNA(Gln) amidotransferase subunit A
MVDTFVAKMQTYLDLIEQKKELNIFLHLNPDALKQAEELDKRKAAGEQLGELAGMAIAVKSNICVDGIIANCASKTLENYKATYDADVITKIKAQDGIIIGMTNMDEFACGGTGQNSAFGCAVNPKADVVPGGSSSGSAAAVAAGLCDAALGSDTGGSIRTPASHCGVVGVKPSYGRVSRYGLIDLSMSLDQVGPLARDVETATRLFGVISGYSENDATTFERDVDLVLEDKNFRVGVSDDFKKLCVDERIYEKVLSVVESMNLQQVQIPHVNLAIQTYYPLVYVEFFSGTRKFDGRKYGYKIEDSCGDEALRRILGGEEISKAEHDGKYYRTALAVKDMIAKSINTALEHVDVLVLPTTPKLPQKFGETLTAQEEYAYDAYTIPANLAGICAGVVPIGEIDGIPVGLQVFAKAFDEKTLLSFMKKIEVTHVKK